MKLPPTVSAAVAALLAAAAMSLSSAVRGRGQALVLFVPRHRVRAAGCAEATIATACARPSG